MLRPAILTKIERTYHRNCPQQRMGDAIPIESETVNLTAHVA